MSRNDMTPFICILFNPVAFDRDWSMILTSLGQCLAKAGDVMATTTAAATKMLFMDSPPVKGSPITSVVVNLRTIRKRVN